MSRRATEIRAQPPTQPQRVPTMCGCAGFSCGLGVRCRLKDGLDGRGSGMLTASVRPVTVRPLRTVTGAASPAGSSPASVRRVLHHSGWGKIENELSNTRQTSGPSVPATRQRSVTKPEPSATGRTRASNNAQPRRPSRLWTGAAPTGVGHVGRVAAGVSAPLRRYTRAPTKHPGRRPCRATLAIVMASLVVLPRLGPARQHREQYRLVQVSLIFALAEVRALAVGRSG